MNIENEIKVSVCVVTYNQENYIAECLDSLVNQKTNFKFEIIVGEDCSTDNTRAIVQKFIDKYPKLIVPIFHEKNVGAVENIKQVYLKAKGKYIAHMDGDDLAKVSKLQKQFEILENHPDCNICSHDMYKIDQTLQETTGSWVYPEKQYNLFDLYHKLPFFAHSSKMFRNKDNSTFWSNLLNMPIILDIDIHVANTVDGDIYHIGEALGVYRVNSGVSNINKTVNSALPLGAIRIYEKGLIIFQDDESKLDSLKGLYANAMLQCAYNYAVYDKDTILFSEFVKKSFQQKFIGMRQLIFKVATYFPTIFFRIFSLRSRIRNQ